MPNIVYAGSASAPGASVAFSSSIDLEGYNYITFTLPPGQKVTVDLGAADGSLKLLVIDPTPASVKLTYQLDGAGADLALDQPLILAGAGALTPFATVNTLLFKNAIAPPEPVTIEILLGRDAVTAPVAI